MSTILENSIWPNAGGTPGEIKTQIPDGVTIKWPDGDALVGNFVYKDGSLVGFVDTKALILNDSATTVIPYDYANITLDCDLEGDLNIVKGERCKYLKVNYTKLPIGFTELEYLEGSGTQYILLPEPFTTTEDFSFSLEAKQTRASSVGTWQHIFGERSGNYDTGIALSDTTTCVVAWKAIKDMSISALERFSVFCDVSKVVVNGIVSEWDNSANVGREVPYLRVFDKIDMRRFNGRIFNVKVRNAGAALYDLVPVLNAGGEPGMYDKVSRKFFKNVGTGAFGYRIRTTGEAITPLSLRDSYFIKPSGIWAKITGENKLDIIADTDMQDGEKQSYKWFANTAEAYDYFNILEKD